MSSETQTNETTETTKKRGKTIDEKMAALEAELQSLKKKKNEMVRQEREKTAKAVNALFQSEGLLDVSADVWKDKMPQVKKALGLDAA